MLALLAPGPRPARACPGRCNPCACPARSESGASQSNGCVARACGPVCRDRHPPAPWTCAPGGGEPSDGPAQVMQGLARAREESSGSFGNFPIGASRELEREPGCRPPRVSKTTAPVADAPQTRQSRETTQPWQTRRDGSSSCTIAGATSAGVLEKNLGISS
jgi:hypothetical protein